MTVSIRKFRIIVLVSNRIEYCRNYSIPFKISNIRTALDIRRESPAALPPCGRTFTCVEQIVGHLDVEHLGGPEQTDHACRWLGCARYGRQFKFKFNLVNHVRVHTGERPFQCPLPGCGKLFTLRDRLKYHERTHTGKWKHTCKEGSQLQ